MEQILINDVVLLLPMEMENWDSEILHLKCPAVLGVSFESHDFIWDMRFCGPLVALSPVAVFSLLFYKSRLHSLHCARIWKIQLVSLCPAPHSSPVGAAQIESIFPGTIALIQPSRLHPPSSPGPYWIGCEHFFPTSAIGKDRSHVSCVLPYLQRHTKPCSPVYPDWTPFLRIQWFRSLLCARVSSLRKSGHRKGLTHIEVSP